MTRTGERPRPYWLGGEETCERCYARYVYEQELRCDGCDAGLCPGCVVVVRETFEVWCVGCEPSGESSEESPRERS